MIPKSISKEHILLAIGKIDRDGVPQDRKATKFHLSHCGNVYPPKYVLSLANQFANGTELEPSQFSGGKESNTFLEQRGFVVVPANKSVSPISDPTAEKRKEKNSGEAVAGTSKGKVKKGPFSHDARCSDCKNAIIDILRVLFGTVKIKPKFQISTRIEDYKQHVIFPQLKAILGALQDYRGYTDFIRVNHLAPSDLLVPDPGFVVEIDETQHFSLARRAALIHYPDSLPVGFDKTKYVKRCEIVRAQDNDPKHRDEQRAWYDTLRDFFPVILGMRPTVRIVMGERAWCSLDPKNADDIKRFCSYVPGLPEQESAHSAQSKQHLSVATILIESDGNAGNADRIGLLRQVLKQVGNDSDVVLLPGGFLSYYDEPRKYYSSVEEAVLPLLKQLQRPAVVCLGIDGRDSVDQIALAIDKGGIIAAGRKFHPTAAEEGIIVKAQSYTDLEDGYPRTFGVNGRKAFLAVCYDSFGIRHKQLRNPHVDIVLNCVHGFFPPGQGDSGDVYFARHGFAGASKKWGCPAFGAAVFFNRKIPPNWPSGILWNQGSKSTQDFKYSDNPITQPDGQIIRSAYGSETALVRIFKI